MVWCPPSHGPVSAWVLQPLLISRLPPSSHHTRLLWHLPGGTHLVPHLACSSQHPQPISHGTWYLHPPLPPLECTCRIRTLHTGLIISVPPNLILRLQFSLHIYIYHNNNVFASGITVKWSARCAHILRLNIDPATLRDFESCACHDFTGPGPYPTVMLPHPSTPSLCPPCTLPLWATSECRTALDPLCTRMPPAESSPVVGA